MLPDYLVIGGVEIINTARAVAYSSTVGDCGALADSCFDCPEGTDRWLNDGEPYQGIALDPAPWFDDAIPESLGVTGIIGLTVQGISEARWAEPGGSNSSPSGAVRDIEFTVGLNAVDECSLSYGIAWLATALGKPTCGDTGCIGQSACMIACCPDITDPDTGTASNDPIRQLFDVVTVEGPTMDPTEVFHGTTQVRAEVEFTLRTTNTGIYRVPGRALTVEATPINGRDVTVDLPAIYEACADPPDCSVDPECVPPDLAQLPEPPVDPCYPQEPFPAKRSVLTIPSTFVPDNFDVVPVIEVQAGSSPLRNLVIRFYTNPFDATCENLPDLNPCRACSDVMVPYVPARGLLEIDGRTGRSLITCRSDEGEATHVPVVFGPMGRVAELPIIQCGSGLCIEVYTAQSVAPDAMVVIGMATRQEAA